MKNELKIWIIMLLVPIGILTYNLILYKFFAPKYQNVERNVWQYSKSNINGNIQILANYYRQYQQHPENREALENVIRMEFANFPADTITSESLRNFLIRVRGY